MSDKELFECLKRLSKTNNLRDGIDIRKEEANIIVNEIERLEQALQEEKKTTNHAYKLWKSIDNSHIEKIYKLEQKIERLNKEVNKYKTRCFEALKLIRENYGLLDKYGIDMLDDILNGSDKE